MGNNDKFMKWVIDNVSCFDNLSKDDLINLKNKYDDVQRLLDIETNTLNMALNHNQSGIDYSTSFEKSSQKRVLAQQELRTYIDELNKKYGIEDKDINNLRK